MKFLEKAGGAILDILFPPICLNCRRGLNDAEKPQLVCRKCLETIIIRRYFERWPSFILAAAADYQNEAVRNLIHYFKYKEFIAAAKPLGELMIQHLENSRLIEEATKFDLIVPIPLHPIRLRRRGFNQAEKLAAVVSRRLNLPVESYSLIRIKNTPPQAKLENEKQREENIKGAFAINPKYCERLKNKSIILIDDVWTSGATVKEAIRHLRSSGVKKIIVLVAAKA